MKNETLDILKNRRSIRQYKSRQISNEELDAVLEAGTYAPTANGRQSPVILAVQDPEKIKQLSKMNAKVLGQDNDPYYGAPTVLLVLAERGSQTGLVDGCSVMVNLLNAAYAVGLGSCWIAREQEMFDSQEGQNLLKEWGLEGDYTGIAACLLGYPAGEHPAPAARKPNYVIKI